MEVKAVLFKNDYKETDKHPDFKTGSKFEINGVKHQIAAWVRKPMEDKKGYLYIKAQLGYKETGTALLDMVCEVPEVSNRQSDKVPDYSHQIKLGGIVHNIAIWHSDKGGLSLKINEKDSKPAAPKETPFPANTKASAPVSNGDDSDELPF